MCAALRKPAPEASALATSLKASKISLLVFFFFCFLFCFAIVLGFLSEIPEKVFVLVYLCPLGVSQQFTQSRGFPGEHSGVWAVRPRPRQVSGVASVFVFRARAASRDESCSGDGRLV